MSQSETLVTHTTCPYCGVGCGVEVSVQDDKRFIVKGDKSHPANLGRLCSKGAALGETLDLEGRLLHPEIHGEQVSWDHALNKISASFNDIIDKHGPDAIAFYVSGQLLTEDYYVANKLMKGFIGSANIDTNSRLCMSSSVAGHKRAFGSDTVPCSYTDLEIADLVVLTGSNTAWCHPVLFQRLRQAKKNRPQMRIVVIDPRATETCDIADLHLAINAGADITLFNGLLIHLQQAGKADQDFIANHTNDVDACLTSAQTDAASLEQVAKDCGLSPQDTNTFYQWFAETEKTITVYSQGVNQWSCGTDKVNAIINCHLLTGRIGKAGQGPFSFTGQPNAMGGREVGGLANQLAAHMDFSTEHIETVKTFWDAPNIAEQPGLKAVDMFNAIASGQIKAIWIMATNPLVSMPEADTVRQSLEQCELVIVSDCVKRTDTTELADILLPALAWGEKDGTVTNSERRISRQRKFLTEPGEAKADWWIVNEVAKRMGFAEAFDFDSADSIWREHASLSAADNEQQRDFDLSGLQNISKSDYDRLQPVQWPCPGNRNINNDSVQMFENRRFFHADQKARFIPVKSCDDFPKTSIEYPLVMNTGRVRDQWHSMTRTGKVARLSNHFSEPFIEIHPEDAARFLVQENDLVTINSQHGTMHARALVSDKQKKGNVFIPMHWNRMFANGGNVDNLVNAITDPVSGQPQFKHTPVSIQPAAMAWQGFILSNQQPAKLPFSHWVKQKKQQAYRFSIADDKLINDWNSLAKALFPQDGDWIEYHDQSNGYYRAALINNNKLVCCIYIASDNSLPDDQWIDSIFNEETLSPNTRINLLSGQPPVSMAPAGKTICACFNVGLNTIKEAIVNQKLTTTDQIGELLKAGTNCGSCLPELKEILKTAGK
ncbi:MAG: molybdopterin-dependent oxidoreductase [Gammaproteobacteria bacterium]